MPTAPQALPSTTGAGAITLAKQQPRSALLFQHQQGGDTVFTLAAMKPGAKVEQVRPLQKPAPPPPFCAHPIPPLIPHPIPSHPTLPRLR